MDQTQNKTLEEWNDEVAFSLIPNILLLSLFYIFGVFGNLMVVVVYEFQMKKVSEQRYFIPILAFFDMIAAGYCISAGIYHNLHHVNFTNEILCQTTQFFIGFTTFTPIILLLVIAFQRFFKVCRPTSIPMSLKLRRWLIVVSVGISLVVALPIPFVYGIMPIHSNKYLITGTICGKRKDGNKLVRALYGVVIGLFTIIVTIILLVLYSRIVKQIFNDIQTTKFQETQKDAYKMQPENPELTAKNNFDLKTGKFSTTNENDQNHEPHNNDLRKSTEYNSQKVTKDHSTKSTNVPCREQSASQRRIKRNKRVSYKITFIFFVITIAFFLSYIPKVATVLLEGIELDIWEQLDDEQRPGFMFVYQMYIINNIVNPVIYAFMDTKFRKETKQLLRRLFFISAVV